MNKSLNEEIKVDSTTINLLVYEDDIVLLGNNINSGKFMCKNYRHGKKIGLKINEGKTEYMEIRR